MQKIMSQAEFRQMMATAPSGLKPIDAIKYLQSQGIQIQGVSSYVPGAPVATSAQAETSPSFLQRRLSKVQGALSFGSGISGGGVSTVANILGGAANILTPKKYEQFTGEKIKELGQEFKEKTAYEPESKTYQAGELVGTVGTELATAIAGGAPIRAVALPAATAKLGTTAGKIAAGLVATPVETAAVTLGERGELPTEKEFELAGAAEIILGGLGAAFNKYAPDIFRIGANPKGKNYTDIEWKAGEATGKYGGTKKMIVNQADNVIKTDSKLLDAELDPVKTIYTRKQFADGARELAGQYKQSDPGLAEDIYKYADEWEAGTLIGEPKAIPIAMKGKVKDLMPTIAEAQTAAALKTPPQELSAKELRVIKTDLGQLLSNVFEKGKTGDPKIAARLQALEGIWGAIDTELNKISPAVRKLNEEMTVAYSLKIPLSKDLEKPAIQGVFQMIANPKSIPGVTPVTTVGAGLMQKISKILEAPGVPQSVKAAILELLGE